MSDSEKMNEETADQQESNEKTFTQAEVDEIIRKRLARERRKAETESNTDGEQDTGDDREKTLEERELRVMAKEKLLDSGMPSNLADVLRYSDEKSLEKAIEAIKNLKQEPRKAWAERMDAHHSPGIDPIRKAMGLGR